MKNNAAVNGEFDKLYKIFKSKPFLKSEGLAGEVPFYIYHFTPDLQNGINKMTDSLIKRLLNDGIQVLDINLYVLTLNILRREGDLEYILENEPTFANKNDLLAEIQNYLDIQKVVIPEIKRKIDSEKHEIVFITGVGLVYPYIRSHNILNNLQKISHKPTVMFFPGEYSHHGNSGSSLNLFGKLLDDRYYRAKDLDLYEN